MGAVLDSLSLSNSHIQLCVSAPVQLYTTEAVTCISFCLYCSVLYCTVLYCSVFETLTIPFHPCFFHLFFRSIPTFILWNEKRKEIKEKKSSFPLKSFWISSLFNEFYRASLLQINFSTAAILQFSWRATGRNHRHSNQNLPHEPRYSFSWQSSSRLRWRHDCSIIIHFMWYEIMNHMIWYDMIRPIRLKEEDMATEGVTIMLFRGELHPVIWHLNHEKEGWRCKRTLMSEVLAMQTTSNV